MFAIAGIGLPARLGIIGRHSLKYSQQHRIDGCGIRGTAGERKSHLLDQRTAI